MRDYRSTLAAFMMELEPWRLEKGTECDAGHSNHNNHSN